MSHKYAAPAKVNLHLAVTRTREDGYHELDTSFVYVDVGDTLTIKSADDLHVRCSDESLDGEQNLVYQVLKAFGQKFQTKFQFNLGLDVFIEKKLPSQAGLGGGSSDAATALMVANVLWGIDCSKEELIAFATPFGADIPCFLFGQASMAKGVGENLLPYTEEIPTQFVVLAWPGVGVSTAKAFAHFDENKFHALTDEKAAAKVRARSDDGSFELGFNDLEQSAISLCSPLAMLLQSMREKSDRAWMSGSGSACVALCDSSKQAEELVGFLQEEALAAWVHIGHFVLKHPLQSKNDIGA